MQPKMIKPNELDTSVQINENHLIASLTEKTKSDLLATGRVEQFEKGTVLESQGQPPVSVYFILSGLLVSIFEGSDGTVIANAMRGPEAAYGAINAGRNVDTAASATTGRVLATIPTTVFTIPIADFYKVMIKSNDLLRIILSHAADVVRKHELTLNCSRHHRIENRLAHLLGLLYFYNNDVNIPTTHSELGEMLGVRRESISTALAEFEKREILQVNRGRVGIKDSDLLDHYSCDCHHELILLKLGRRAWKQDC